MVNVTDKSLSIERQTNANVGPTSTISAQDEAAFRDLLQRPVTEAELNEIDSSELTEMATKNFVDTTVINAIKMKPKKFDEL